MARDNTVKYQWRVLQLPPGEERPSYAGLRVKVLERADGDLMLRYQAEVVDFQEGPPPSSALWGNDSGYSSDPELEKVADGVANSHLNQAQQALLSTLEPADEDDANVEGVATRRRGEKEKPLRHQSHRTPTATQQARWESVHLVREQGLSLRAIARNLGMAKNTAKKYAVAGSPPPRNSAPRSEPKSRLW